MDAEGGISLHQNRFNLFKCTAAPLPPPTKTIKHDETFWGKKEASSVKRITKELKNWCKHKILAVTHKCLGLYALTFCRGNTSKHIMSKARSEKISDIPHTPCFIEDHLMVFLWIFVVGAAECHMGYPVCPVKEVHQHSFYTAEALIHLCVCYRTLTLQ